MPEEEGTQTMAPQVSRFADRLYLLGPLAANKDRGARGAPRPQRATQLAPPDPSITSVHAHKSPCPLPFELL